MTLERQSYLSREDTAPFFIQEYKVSFIFSAGMGLGIVLEAIVANTIFSGWITVYQQIALGITLMVMNIVLLFISNRRKIL